MREMTRKPAAREPQQHGDDRHGPLSDALNGRAAVQAQMALGETLNAGRMHAPVQRMMNESDEDEVSDPKTALISAIGKEAGTFGLTLPEGKGEFISSSEVGDPDFQRNTAHIHLYKNETAAEDDSAVLVGHAVWNKRGGQNRQRFQINATKAYGYWEVGAPEWSEYQEAVEGANPDAKRKLLEIVETDLPQIFERALANEFP